MLVFFLFYYKIKKRWKLALSYIYVIFVILFQYEPNELCEDYFNLNDWIKNMQNRLDEIKKNTILNNNQIKVYDHRFNDKAKPYISK